MFSHRFSSQLLAGTAIALTMSAPAFADNAAQKDEQVAAAPRPLGTISVTGEGTTTEDFKVDQSSLGKFTEKLRDTPQTIDTVSAEVIEQRNITSMQDAFRNVPGITIGASEFNWQGNNPNIRGFNSRGDMFVDGMRDFGMYFRDPFNYDHIEVLQGPASMVFGRGSIGGVINSVSKEASLDSRIFGSLNFGTDGTKRVAADINEAMPELGEGAAVRLNAMGHDGSVAGRDGGKQQRWGVGGSLALGLGTPTRLVLDFVHQANNDVPDYGLPWFGTQVADVPRNNFYGFSSDYQRAKADIVNLKADHDYNDDLKLHAQVRYGHYSRENRITEPQITAAVGTPVASVTVNRNVFTGFAEESFLQAQMDARYNLVTGPVTHAIVAGIEGGRERSNPWLGFALGVPGTNLLTPAKNAFFSSTSTPPNIVTDTTANTFGIYAIDTIKINEMFQIVGGIRYDNVDINYGGTRYNATTGAFVSADRFLTSDSEFSYRGGLVFKPMEAGTVYFSYGNSFNPSSENLTFVTSARGAFPVQNVFLEPEKNTSYELGTKWEWMDGKLATNAALFRTTKDNARVPNPATPGFNALDGTQRAQGLDVSVTGRVTDAWQLMAGYVYLDGEVTKSPTGAPAVGAPLPYAPKHSFSFWTSYQITEQVLIGGGGQRVGLRYAQNTAPIRFVPGYWTFDAMAQYNLSEHLTFKVNLTNLTDKYYYDALHQQHVVPGAGRTAMFAVNLNY